MAASATSVGELLYLFDQKWFNHNIIFPKNPDQDNQEKSQHPTNITPKSSQLLVRSLSDQILSFDSSNGNVSPDSVLPTMPTKLQTILSGKEFNEFGEKIEELKQGRNNREVRGKRRRKRGERKLSKSLSELEFEELEGFMDLGFVFSEEDKSSSLASVIPGLQLLGKKQGIKRENDDDVHDDDEDRCRVSRPYLSEAWEMFGHRKEELNALMNWKFPRDLVCNEMDMKNHLRFWAHAVASIVR